MYVSIGNRTSLLHSTVHIHDVRTVQNIRAPLSLWDVDIYNNKPYFTIQNCYDFSHTLFPPNCIINTSAVDLQLLQKLGVQVMKRSDFYRDVILVNIEALMRCYPEDTTVSLFHYFFVYCIIVIFYVLYYFFFFCKICIFLFIYF